MLDQHRDQQMPVCTGVVVHTTDENRQAISIDTCAGNGTPGIPDSGIPVPLWLTSGCERGNGSFPIDSLDSGSNGKTLFSYTRHA